MHVRIRNVDTDTHPCVFHHAGGDSLCRTGLELKRHYFDAIGEPERSFAFAKNRRLSGLEVYRRPRPAETIRRLPKLSIVTFTSFRFPGSAELSLRHLGIHVDVIRPPGRWRNLRKIGLMRRYLETVETEYVLCLDSHDAFVTDDILGIVPAFEKMGCRMLVQADAHDWPENMEGNHAFFERIAGDQQPFRYLCGGIYIGDVEFLKRYFDLSLQIEPVLPNDDQGPYKLAFERLHPDCRLDYRCELFQSLTDYAGARRRDRFRAIELNLELEIRTDPTRARTPPKPKRARLAVAVPYFLGRFLDPIADRLAPPRDDA